MKIKAYFKKKVLIKGLIFLASKDFKALIKLLLDRYLPKIPNFQNSRNGK